MTGEDYDGDGGCVKYTDKWAERLGGEGQASEQVCVCVCESAYLYAWRRRRPAGLHCRMHI